VRIACIVPIFNFADDPIIEQNHRRSVAALAEEPNVEVFPIRATLGDVGGPYWPDWESLPTDSVLWQKEALINYAAEKLRRKYPVLAWVDSGLYLDPGWAERLRLRIGLGFSVVQLYSRGVWLGKTGRQTSYRAGYLFYRERHFPGRDKVQLSGGKPKPSVGGAWAARSGVFGEIKLYDRAVTGGGDTWALQGLAKVNTPEAIVTKYLQDTYRAHVQRWIKRARQVDLSAGWITGSYYHLWHTNQASRQHGTRHRVLVECDYNPARHTILRRNGLLDWTEEAPAKLVDTVREYLLSRAGARL